MVELSSTPNDIRDAFVESLDWWREAGVEEHVSDTPGGWLRAREEPLAAPDAVTAPPPPPPAEPPRKGAVSRFIESGEAPTHPGDPDQWPGDLADFRKWWMESDAIDPPGAYPRVSPRGVAGAQAMLIVDQPLVEDTQQLLQGPAGTLAANMLRAMGIAEDARYVASVLPRHTLRPDWPMITDAGYGRLLLHHLALARPQRVLACGERVWSLLSHEMAQEPGALTTVSCGSANAPAFAVPDLPTLLRNPAKRAQTWNRWLDWSASHS